MTPSILKQIFPCIEIPLCDIITKCLEEGHYPHQLKKAKIIPVHKKGDIDSPENYRPISILPVFSKLFQKIIKNRLMSFFKHTGILSKQQHGYLMGRSVETAITEMLKKISKAFDEGQKCSLHTCDLSKAFDTIDHDLLLKKLEYYGIRGQALKLLKSYLTGRMQTTSICDDTSFLNIGKSEQELQESDRKTIEEAQIWFSSNRMKMNADKTQHMLFDTLRNDHMRFLGIMIQSNLKFTKHTEELIPRLSRATYAIRRIKQIAGTKAAKITYFSYFHSILNFAILTWGETTESKRIFVKQKQALRILCGVSNRHSCRELFPKEKILTLTSIFILNCVLYIYDNKEILLENNFNHTYNTRNKNNFLIPYHRLVAAQLNVNYLAIKVFNRLPSKLKELDRRRLKGELKSILLKKAYYRIDEYMEDTFWSP